MDWAKTSKDKESLNNIIRIVWYNGYIQKPYTKNSRILNLYKSNIYINWPCVIPTSGFSKYQILVTHRSIPCHYTELFDWRFTVPGVNCHCASSGCVCHCASSEGCVWTQASYPFGRPSNMGASLGSQADPNRVAWPDG